MEVNPMEYVEEEKGAAQELLAEERKDSKLNAWVAIAIALLATFVAICTVAERGLVKEMQHQQTISLDSWNFYQSRTIRSAVAQTAADQFAIEALSATGASKAAFEKKAAEYKKEADYQNDKKKVQMDDAKKADETYEKLKQRDEHYELSEAILAIAVSLLALTSLTHKKWLFFVAMVPTAVGAFLGFAGLAHIHLHLDAISRLLQ
ncbi:MAG: DUF4337 domain-containing protein [Capsulimonadaceae bacterium]|nr:DUF4337 domain-containing protein [Capsulimonadaceae bacterium]